MLAIALGYLYLETHRDKVDSELALQKKLRHEAEIRKNNLRAQVEAKLRVLIFLEKYVNIN